MCIFVVQIEISSCLFPPGICPHSLLILCYSLEPVLAHFTLLKFPTLPKYVCLYREKSAINKASATLDSKPFLSGQRQKLKLSHTCLRKNNVTWPQPLPSSACPATPVCTLTFRSGIWRTQIKLSHLNISAEGNGTPLQYSCLENPMDGGAW